MTNTKIDLCSQALVKLGAKNIASMDEDTTESMVAQQLYEPTLQNLLTSYPWRFALQQCALGRLDETPMTDYQYAFQVPNDCLRILSAGQNSKSAGLTYRLVGQKLYANVPEVVLTYISRPEESSFPAFFNQALADTLAAEFCLPLTESSARTDYMKKCAKESVAQARLIDSQQSVHPCFQDFSLIEVRS